MSVEVSATVWRRYPEGGNELLLALALADSADPDGTHIFSAVATYAAMTRQSERSVQRLIGKMLVDGWLILVRKATGRRGSTNEYRISPEWLKGGQCVPPAVIPDRRASSATGDKLAPVNPVDKLSTTGDTTGTLGDTAVSPNPSLPGIPIPPLPPVGTGGCGQQTAEQPESARRERRRWRWADTRSGIEGRARELGVPAWDSRALALGGEIFESFAARVFVAHLATVGLEATVDGVRTAMRAQSSWASVLRQWPEVQEATL